MAKFKMKQKIDNVDRDIDVDLTSEMLTDDILKELGLSRSADVSKTHMPKDAFEAELDRRVKSLTKGKYALEDLDTNEDLKKQVLARLGVKVTKEGKAELTADQVAELENAWKDRHLKPVATELESTKTRVALLTGKSLERDIIAAAATAGVKKSLLTPVAKDKAAPIVTMLRDVFRRSDEHDSFFVSKGDDAFEFSSDPKGTGSPYMGVAEFVAGWTKDKNNADFVDAKRPGGASVGSPGGGSGGVVELRTPEDGRPLTLQDYKAAEKQAGDGGRVAVKTAGT